MLKLFIKNVDTNVQINKVKNNFRAMLFPMNYSIMNLKQINLLWPLDLLLYLFAMFNEIIFVVYNVSVIFIN